MIKKIISIILVIILIGSVAASSALFVNAVTYITYGDWLLAINSDTTYLVGGYNGTDTALSFPETANNKAIIGVAEDFYDKCETELTAVTLPDSYSIIESFAFYGMTSLESINIPSNLTNLGAMAFCGCTSLEAIDFSGVTQLSTIPHACFSGCTSLQAVVFPNGLKTVTDYAFNYTAVESVTIPYGVTSLGNYSFLDCALLTDIVLPTGLQSIGEGAFFNDSSLTSIYVPATVTEIGSNAFFPMAVTGNSLTIDCYEGSYAAEYAYENHLNFTTTPMLRGDVDNNGKVNIRDVTYIQLYLVNKYEISIDTKTLDRIDVYNDGKLNIRDATKIQQYKVGIIDSL